MVCAVMSRISLDQSSAKVASRSGGAIYIVVSLESIGVPYRFGLPSVLSLLACAPISGN